MPNLKDGLKTLVFITGVDSSLFGEIEITPPGITGRGPIDMVGLRNVDWATQLPKSLKNLTPLNAKLMFDPQFIPAAWAAVQKNRQFTVQFPNGAQLYFWGWLEEINHDPHSEGNRPTLNVVIHPSNLNTQCVLTPPVWVAGTTGNCA